MEHSIYVSETEKFWSELTNLSDSELKSFDIRLDEGLFDQLIDSKKNQNDEVIRGIYSLCHEGLTMNVDCNVTPNKKGRMHYIVQSIIGKGIKYYKASNAKGVITFIH